MIALPFCWLLAMLYSSILTNVRRFFKVRSCEALVQTIPLLWLVWAVLFGE